MRVYPHRLRHTMARRLVNGGMPIENVRTVLGHESIDTTRVYAETETKSVPESFEEAREDSEGNLGYRRPKNDAMRPARPSGPVSPSHSLNCPGDRITMRRPS